MINPKTPIKTIISITLIILYLILSSNIIFSQTNQTNQYKLQIGSYPITIELYRIGDTNKIEGRYKYDRVGKWLKLEGEIKKGQNFVKIFELDRNKKLKGYFMGIISKDKKYIKLTKWYYSETSSKNIKITPQIWIKLKEKRKYKLGDFDEAWVEEISKNGNFAIVYLRKKVNNKVKVTMQVNNKIHDLCDQFIHNSLDYSQNEYRYSFECIVGDKRFLHINETHDQNYMYYYTNKGKGLVDDVFPVYYSKDGSKYFFSFKENNKDYIHISINEKNIELPEKNFKFGPLITNDGSTLAAVYYLEGNKGYYVIVNEEVYGPYEDIIDFDISSDNPKVYGFIYKKNNELFVFNKEVGAINLPYDEVNSIRFSQNGSKFAFEYVMNNKYFIRMYYKIPRDKGGWVYSYKDFGPFDYLFQYQFSPNNSKLGLVFKKEGGFYVQIDNTTFGPYYYEDFLYNSLTMSADGSYFMVSFINKKDKEKNYFLHINDKVYGPYESAIPIKFSQKDFKYSFISKENNLYYLNLNEKKYGPFNDYKILPEFFSYNSNIVFEFKIGNKNYLQINDRIYGPFDKYIYQISQNFNSLMIAYEKDKVWYVETNDMLYGPYEGVYSSVLNPVKPGKYAFVFVKDGEIYLQTESQRYGPFKSMFEAPLSVKFSKDGSLFGFKYNKNDKDYIQINDKTYGPFYSWAGFTFTDNNKTYIAYIDDENRELIIEEVE